MTISGKAAAGLALLAVVMLAWLGANTYLSLTALSEARGPEARDSDLMEQRLTLGNNTTIVAPVLLKASSSVDVRLRGVEQTRLDAFGEIAQRQIANLTNNRWGSNWVRISGDLSKASLEIWDWRGGDQEPLEIPLDFSPTDFQDYIQPVAESMQEEIAANYEDATVEFHRLLVYIQNRAGEFIQFETHFTYTERLEILDEAYVDDVPEWRVRAWATAGRY